MRSRRSEKAETGASAVEFSFILLPFITLVFGMVQFGWFFFVSNSASGAAREAGRRIVVGECWDTTSMLTFVQAQAPTATSATFTPADLGTYDVGEIVTVTVVADANILGFLPMPNGGVVTREFQARLEDKQPGDGSCSS